MCGDNFYYFQFVGACHKLAKCHSCHPASKHLSISAGLKSSVYSLDGVVYTLHPCIFLYLFDNNKAADADGDGWLLMMLIIMVLWQVAKAASTSLNNCVNCLPGLREVDEIVKHVSTVSIKLTSSAQVSF